MDHDKVLSEVAVTRLFNAMDEYPQRIELKGMPKVTAVSKHGYPSTTAYLISWQRGTVTLSESPHGPYGEQHIFSAEAWTFYLETE